MHENLYYSGKYIGIIQLPHAGTLTCRVRDALGIYESETVDILRGEWYNLLLYFDKNVECDILLCFVAHRGMSNKRVPWDVSSILRGQTS